MKAYVNHSRWIVECPCKNAAVVALVGEGDGGKYDEYNNETWVCNNCKLIHTVDMPRERAQIEKTLMLRSDPLNRNWLPGETIADLRIENAAHKGD